MSLQQSSDGAVLVTGAQGFIGSWLTERLLQRGERVVAPNRPAPERSRWHSAGLGARCELVDLDLLDTSSAQRVLNEHGVETVFHLAAQTITSDAGAAPLQAFAVNARGTYNLLEASRLATQSGLETRVVVASSYHVYGPSVGGRVHREGAPLAATEPYAASKACADMLARSYGATYDLPVAVTRLANVYGGGDMNFSRLLPAAARALVEGRSPVLRSDGTPERNFIHASDAVDAYLAVAASLDRPVLWGRAWNAGAQEPVAVGEIVGRLVAASRRTGLKAEIRDTPRASGEIDRQHLDSSAIAAELGWTAGCDLTSGLAETFGWYEEHLP